MSPRTTETTVLAPVEAVWATLWNEGEWPALTDLVDAVEVLEPGDRHGNGRLRRIHQHRRWWDPTIMMERTERVAHHRAVEARVHHHRADVTHRWRLDLAPRPDAVDLRLEEEVEVGESRYPGEARLLADRLLALRPALLEGLREQHGDGART